jgi:hypothetical protein
MVQAHRGPDTHRVLAEQMTARARFIDTRFTDFGERFRIEAPR